MNDADIRKIMKLFADADLCGELYWDQGLNFYVVCNDLFYWGCADCEAIETSDIPLVIDCIEQSENYAMELYCAKKRGMRPQGAYYKFLTPAGMTTLFDACGPERDPNESGNTPKPKE